MKNSLAQRTARLPLYALPVLLVAVVAAQATPAAARQDSAEDAVAAASRRALAWFEGHRATPQDGGLADMIDEGVSLRVFRRLAATPAARARFAQLFRDQMAAIDALPAFASWAASPYKPLIDHYHLVLAAYLMQIAGQDSSSLDLIREQAQRALGSPGPDCPTVRLTTALFLSRLGQARATPVQELLDQSVIARLAANPQLLVRASGETTTAQRRANTWLLYALVHEVVALTDFGHLPPPPWLAARRAAVARLLRDAVSWSSSENNLDLAAELIVTLYLLGEPLDAELRHALDRLIGQQHVDGSWGPSATTVRQNKVRHTVLTATAALLAYRAWRNAPGADAAGSD